MITLIKGSWVVGYDGEKHRLITDGEVAYENDKIIYVGRNYEGPKDKVIDGKGMLVHPDSSTSMRLPVSVSPILG